VDRYLNAVTKDNQLKEKDFFALRKKLLETAVPFYEQLAEAKLGDQDQEAARGRAYERLAYVRQQLGEKEAALADYERMRTVFAQLAADFPHVPRYRQELAKCHHNLGLLLAGLGQRPQAEAEHRRALALHEQLAAAFPTVPINRQALATSHNNLGRLLQDLGKGSEAEAEYRQALALQRQLAADFPNVPACAVALGGSYCNLGHLEMARSKPATALEWYAKAVATLRPVLVQEPRLVQARQFLRNTHIGQAEALSKLGRHAEATAAVEKLLELESSDARILYNAACIYALAAARVATAAAPTTSPLQAEQHARRAVALLRQAVQQGFKDLALLKKDTDLDGLRQRADFRRLLADLETKAPRE
jgi:tetratricopeptide (TPR) repeat protein